MFPKLFTIGVDAFAPSLEEARQNATHDAFVLADIGEGNLALRVREAGYESLDLVVLLDVVEHFPRQAGFRLLEACESLAAKYVLVKTPNGFVPQGPEYGNPWQRHLSGWFAHDFESLGYRVYGADGMKCMLGYAGAMRYRYPGASLLQAALARWLRVTSHPRRAFSLLAVKSMAGHPAILGERLRDPQRLPDRLRYLPPI